LFARISGVSAGDDGADQKIRDLEMKRLLMSCHSHNFALRHFSTNPS